MKKAHLDIVKRLHGKKRLIRGNHDIFDTNDHQTWVFREVLGASAGQYAVLALPAHPDSLGRFKANVHGHIHQQPAPEGAYANACVEWTNYTPVTLEQVAAMALVGEGGTR